MIRAESFESQFSPDDVQELIALEERLMAEPYVDGSEDQGDKGYDPTLDPLIDAPLRLDFFWT